MDNLEQFRQMLLSSLAGGSRALTGAMQPVAQFAHENIVPEYMKSYQMPDVQGKPPGKVGPGEMSPFDIASGALFDVLGPPGGKAAMAAGVPLLRVGKKSFMEELEQLLKGFSSTKTVSPDDPTYAAMDMIDKIYAAKGRLPGPQPPLTGEVLPPESAKLMAGAKLKELGPPPGMENWNWTEIKAYDELAAIAKDLERSMTQGYKPMRSSTDYSKIVTPEPPMTVEEALKGLQRELAPQIEKDDKLKKVENVLLQILSGRGGTKMPDFGWLSSLPPQAREQGFVTPAVHGTKTPTDFGQFMLTPGDIGVHFGTPSAAWDRIRGYQPTVEQGLPGARMFPVMLKTGRQLELPDLGIWRETSMREGLEALGQFSQRDLDAAGTRGLHGFRDLMSEAGYDSIKYKNAVEDPGSLSYIMFRPSPENPKFAAGIRSPFARFESLASPDIMASLLGLGLSGTAAAAYMDQMKRGQQPDQL